MKTIITNTVEIPEATPSLRRTAWSWTVLRFACPRCLAVWVVGGLADLRCSRCGWRGTAS